LAKLVITSSFWQHQKVLLTGHTGFKGGWMAMWMSALGARVTGFSLPPATKQSLFDQASIGRVVENDLRGDIRDLASLREALKLSQASIVIHMAAQPLVFQSYQEPVATYQTNVLGTVNVLEAARGNASVKAVLIITSDKCYENMESEEGYDEENPLGGHDPYSSSKACAEIVASAYRRSFLAENGIAVATTRSGNVIGGGDWSRDRLVPDAVNAFINREPFVVRKPKAVRPWQHVLEPLSGYLLLCQKLCHQPNQFAEAWNFGPRASDEKTVGSLAELMVESWGDGANWVCRGESNQPHEANSLRLDCRKAKTKLEWKPQWTLREAVENTLIWYKKLHGGDNMYEFSIQQIIDYQMDLLT